MANLVRERYNGNFGYYNVNTHINPTNVCVYKCDFCAFRADLNDKRAYVMDKAQILERAKSAHDRGATELHIVGGLHHKLPFSYYVDLVRWIKDAYPEIHIKAYTGVEIEFFAKIAKLSIREVLQELVDAGLGSLPGGGAEIFHPEVREQVCGAKASTDVWARSPPDRPISSGSTPTPPCSTATSTGPNTGSTTWSGSASCRTRPAASRPSSLWRSTPTTRGWTRSPSRPA